MTPELASRILHYLDAVHNQQVDYLRELVRAESPSLEPGTHRAVLELLAKPLEALGFDARILPGRRSGGQLYARPKRRRRSVPAQLLLGHADTVWPTGTLERMPLVQEGTLLRGPGVYDMKAGLSQIVFALKALAAVGVEPAVTPVVYISCDEELGSEDSRFRIRLLARRVVRVLIPEPSAGAEGRIKTSRKGVGLFTITVHGRSAHAGLEPEKGASAILELARIILQLEEVSDPAAGTTVTVGIVEGGTRPNVVPDLARAVVDVRARTAAEADRVTGHLRSLVPSREGIRIEVSGGLDRPPMERTPRNRALWLQACELARLLDLELKETESGGGSDGNLTSPFAATLDGLGAVGGGAHAQHEFVDLKFLPQRTALLALLIAAPPE
jgi:glutamate carboxypeptidase